MCRWKELLLVRCVNHIIPTFSGKVRLLVKWAMAACMILGLTSFGHGMSDKRHSSAPLYYRCTSATTANKAINLRNQTPKGDDLAGRMCPLFMAALTAAQPDRPLRQDRDGPSPAQRIELVVLSAKRSGLEAQINWHLNGQVFQGRPLAVLSANAPLTEAKLRRFLAALIDRTPQPVP